MSAQEVPLFRARGPVRFAPKRRPWLDGPPRRRRLFHARHRLDLRIPVALLAVLTVAVGFLWPGGWAGQSSPVLASTTCQPARIASCYDGDTCDAFVEGRHQSVRLVGLDTPEINHNAKCKQEQRLGLAARDRLRVLIAQAREREFCPEGSSFDRDRYGRVLAILELDGRDVAGILIQEGHAVSYSGGYKQHDWCR